MDVRIAGHHDVSQLARLLWLHASPEEQARQPTQSFTADLSSWWRDHERSHFAFIAQPDDAEVVGMAWLALVPRVPRPGSLTRCSADIQSVFVVPEHRDKGIGSALVETAWQHALHLGAGRVTVSSGRKAVPLYERLGFAPSREVLQRLA